MRATLKAAKPVTLAPAPDPVAIERREQAAVEKVEQLNDRYLLHRKNHVKRLDGRDVTRTVPEFLKRKAPIRRVR